MKQELTEEQRQLVTDHDGRICSIAARYRGAGVSADDLYQEAYLGACIAAQRYDRVRHEHVPFLVYATPWIRKYLLAAIAEAGQEGISGVPHRLVRASHRCRKAQAEMVAEGVPVPGVDQIAARTGLSREIVARAMSLPSLVVQAQSGGILGQLGVDKLDDLADELWDAVGKCDRLEQAVVLKLWGLDGGEPLSPLEAARDLDLSLPQVLSVAERARQVIGDELRRRGWTIEKWQKAFAQAS